MNSCGIKAFVSSQVEDSDWDNYVCRHAEPHHEQTSLWSAARSKSGWMPLRVIFRNGADIVSGAQILSRRVLPLCHIGYLPRGPLVQTGIPVDSVINEIIRVACANHIRYLAVSLPYQADSLIASLLEHGFAPKPPQLPPCIRFQASLVLDLSKDIDQLFAECRATTRKHIRRGQRSGVLVRMGKGSDLATFRRLLHELCARRGVVSNVPGGDFLDELWRRFSVGAHIRLFLAQFQDEVVSALLVVVVGGWARAWRIGWAGRYPEKYPNEVLYWESIKWAKENGCRCYDFVGIDSDDARALLSGRDAAAPFKCTITFFKVGFGGRIILMPGEFCYFPNPIVRLAYRWCGRRLVESRYFNRITAGLAQSQ